MHSAKTIGLIGGVGPWAGLDVHSKILQQCSYQKEQECVSVMHLSYPAHFSDRSEYLLGKTPINPAHAFVKELRFMEASGVDVAAIVCNTAHARPIIEEIARNISGCELRYINIIEETCRKIARDGVQKIGLLATQGTYQHAIYQSYFKGEIIVPKRASRQRVHDCVYHADYGLKVHYPSKTHIVRDELTAIAHELIAQGAEAIVLGCTELPLVANLAEHVPVPLYDSNKILASSLLHAAYAPKENHVIHAQNHIV